MAFVYYLDEDGVASALKLDGTDLNGSILKVRRAEVQQNKTERFERDRHERERTDQLTVFVAGLAFDMDMEVLKKDFGECGEVQAVRMLRKPDGAFKGTAFV